jgi:phage terminase large subunit GpA-like protein
LSLYGMDASVHQMFADHLTAEAPVETTAEGRTLDVWHEKPARDNDWFDCLVYNTVAASMQGAVLKETVARAKPKIVDYAELYKQAQEGKR